MVGEDKVGQREPWPAGGRGGIPPLAAAWLEAQHLEDAAAGPGEPGAAENQGKHNEDPLQPVVLAEERLPTGEAGAAVEVQDHRRR